tara:strand:- start:125 stop:349 length:225 start_codon:yes stop_codon:yes gene_type:complete
MSVNVLDIEVCIGDYVYTWNGKATFNRFKNSDRNKERFSTSCFTRPDMTSWTKAMEAIVSHYEEEDKKRRMPKI